MKKLLTISAVVVMVVSAMMFFGTEVAAQQALNVKANLYHQPFGAAVDCQGNGANTGVPDGGFVNAHLNLTEDSFIFNVHLQDGLPSTTYQVFVRCVGAIGTITTNSQGVGNATFSVSSIEMPSTFAIDMGPLPFSCCPQLDALVSEPITLP
ncbi:MAG: hypothetical protein HYZ72_01345 [Deltaproteobacteria bacterium]|nr:hypothetical protein [Deltaproteobacteria bacterium]